MVLLFFHFLSEMKKFMNFEKMKFFVSLMASGVFLDGIEHLIG